MHLNKGDKGACCDVNTTAYISQNNNDFSICLKVPSMTAGSRSAAGRAFQGAGPEVFKARHTDQG